MKTTKKLLALIFAVVLSFSMIPTTNINAANKVKLNKTKATIYVGKTVTLKLKNNKKKVKWTTSNKKIATVSKKGKVKGKKTGRVTITAKVGKKKYKCKITVKKKQTIKPTVKPTEQPTTKPAETPTSTIEQPTTKPAETPTTQPVEEPTTPSDYSNKKLLNPQIGKNVEKLKEISDKQKNHETIDQNVLNQINETNEAEADNMWSKKFNINDAIQAIINDTTQYNKYINSHGGYYDGEYDDDDDDYNAIFKYNDAIVKYLYDGTTFKTLHNNISCDEYGYIYKYFMFYNDSYNAKFTNLDRNYQYKEIFSNYMKLGHPQIDSIDTFILETEPSQKYFDFNSGCTSHGSFNFDDQICSYVVTFSSNGTVYNAYMTFAEGIDDDDNEFCEYRLLELTDTSEINNYWNYDENEANALKEIIKEQKEQGATISDDISNLEEYSWVDGKLTGIYWNYKNLTGNLDTSAFSSLKYLLCSNNQLTNLNTSKNVALTNLHCYSNQLTNLDFSKNIALIDLDCSNNQLTNLDISKNIALTELDCNSNQLTNLDVSKNISLKDLYCGNNQLKNLDVSKNVVLISLGCYSNQLTNLNISKNIALTDLGCSFNQLPNLDISKNVALASLSCNNNQLTDLNLSNNVNLTYLECYDNKLTQLNILNNTALTRLFCSWNQLSSLDISKNILLTDLDCYNNQLKSLNISNNTALTFLECGKNQLEHLDLSNNTVLASLSCNNNQLKELDLSNNTLLTDLRCDDTVNIIGYSNNQQYENQY